jgi:hypothetical protein
VTFTIRQISDAAGTSRDTINRWIDRGVLETAMPPAQNGVTRHFTRENALEMVFTAALAVAGVSPFEAAAKARGWVHDCEAGGELPAFFTFNPRRALIDGREHDGPLDLDDWKIAEYLTDDFQGEQLPEDSTPVATPPLPPATLVTLNLASMVQRIDASADQA